MTHYPLYANSYSYYFLKWLLKMKINVAFGNNCSVCTHDLIDVAHCQ